MKMTNNIIAPLENSEVDYSKYSTELRSISADLKLENCKTKQLSACSKSHIKEEDVKMQNTYTVSAILSIENEYTFSEYMSLAKNAIIDKFESFERNGFEIKSAKMMIGDTEVSFSDYDELYKTFNDLIGDSDNSKIR